MKGIKSNSCLALSFQIKRVSYLDETVQKPPSQICQIIFIESEAS